MQGWRRTMEDAHLVALNQGPDKNTHIFGVFDGHGGREVAMYVKNHFCSIFLSNKNYQNGNIKTALIESFIQLDQELQSPQGMKELTIEHKQFIEEFDLKQAKEDFYNNFNTNKGYIDNLAFNIGCTANVLIIYKNDMYFANSGDSRSILLRNGEAISMSIDHKPELPNEFERIRKAGGIIKDGRVNGALNLSRSIGDFQFKMRRDLKPKEQIVTCYPDVLFESLSNHDDYIIMGCDGIWECITNEAISDYIYDKIHNNPGISLGTILEELFERNVALDSESEKGSDNMTCLLIQLKKKQTI